MGKRGDIAGDGKRGWGTSIQTILTGRAGAASNKPQHDVLRDAIRDAVRAEMHDTRSDMRILTNMVLVLAATVVALAVFLVVFTVWQLRQRPQTKQLSEQSRERLRRVQPGLARLSSTESLARTGSAQSCGPASRHDSPKRSAPWSLAFCAALRAVCRRKWKQSPLAGRTLHCLLASTLDTPHDPSHTGRQRIFGRRNQIPLKGEARPERCTRGQLARNSQSTPKTTPSLAVAGNTWIVQAGAPPLPRVPQRRSGSPVPLFGCMMQCSLPSRRCFL